MFRVMETANRRPSGSRKPEIFFVVSSSSQNGRKGGAILEKQIGKQDTGCFYHFDI
jgi:hypothetical protein